MKATTIRQIAKKTKITNSTINNFVAAHFSDSAICRKIDGFRVQHRSPLLTDSEAMSLLAEMVGKDKSRKYAEFFPECDVPEQPELSLIHEIHNPLAAGRNDSRIDVLEQRLSELKADILAQKDEESVCGKGEMCRDVSNLVHSYSKACDIPPAGLYCMLYDEYCSRTKARILITDPQTSMLSYITTNGNISVLLACAKDLFGRKESPWRK